MALDYSKWDRIELSDDSDIECHPNVDKRSFIRWKQRDIHEKRAKRNIEIKTLNIQNQMYINLNKRVDLMLEKLNEDQLYSTSERNSFLNAHFDPKEKNKSEDMEDSPTYNEMIEDLFLQLMSDLKKDYPSVNDQSEKKQILRSLVINHRKKIDDVHGKNMAKLKTLEEEAKAHITSDDIHTGFDKAVFNKDKFDLKPPSQSQTSSTSISTDKTKLESPATTATSVSTPDVPSASKTNDHQFHEDNFEILPDTQIFGDIDPDNYIASAKFLNAHPWIISENQKNALLMKAFKYQFDGDFEKARQMVHQSSILLFVATLAGPSNDNSTINNSNYKKIYFNRQKIIKQLIPKIMNSSPARYNFLKDVEETYTHIKNRCEYMHANNEVFDDSPSKNQSDDAEDDEAEGVETIQLKSMDPDSELVVTLPSEFSDDPKEIEKCKYFNQIPIIMQKALKTQSLIEINKVFENIPINEANEILDLFDKCGCISVAAVFDNEEQFQEYKEEQNKEI
ncbi:Hsp90 co-chaperone CDC37 ASCRUDRAFT_24138, partial [Ascoidea rubescens DSM 1968]